MDIRVAFDRLAAKVGSRHAGSSSNATPMDTLLAAAVSLVTGLLLAAIKYGSVTWLQHVRDRTAMRRAHDPRWGRTGASPRKPTSTTTVREAEGEAPRSPPTSEET